MNSTSLCSSIVFVALTATPAAADAGGNSTIKLAPVFNTTWQNSGGKLEVGLGGRSDDDNALQITGQLPLTKDSQGTDLVQLDRVTIPWLTRVIFERGLGEKGWHTKPFIGLDGGLSYNQFGYTPLGAADKQYENGISFNLGARVRVEHYDDFWQTMPQMQLSYARTYSAANKVGIVSPPEGPGHPSTVSERIIAPPDVSPQFGVRVGMPMYFNKLRTPFAVAPVVAWASSGSGWDPFGTVGRARVEAWIWYHPTDDGIKNTRIGVAPFTDFRVSGSDKRDTQIMGVLLEYRTGVTLADI